MFKSATTFICCIAREILYYGHWTSTDEAILLIFLLYWNSSFSLGPKRWSINKMRNLGIKRNSWLVTGPRQCIWSQPINTWHLIRHRERICDPWKGKNNRKERGWDALLLRGRRVSTYYHAGHDDGEGGGDVKAMPATTAMPETMIKVSTMTTAAVFVSWNTTRSNSPKIQTNFTEST